MTNTAKILNFGRGNFAGQERNVADLDDGYARLSNMLLEAYSGADLTKRQFKVLLAILRKTYGWNKPMDRITDSQLSEITKLPVKRCNEAKLELVRMNIIKQQGGMFGPNKNISEWCIPQNEGKSPKTRDKTSLKLGDCYPSKQRDTKDTITKEKRKDYSSENSGESSDQPENDLSVVKPDAAIQSGSKWGTAEDLTAAEWMFDMVKTIAPSARKPNFAGWAIEFGFWLDSAASDKNALCAHWLTEADDALNSEWVSHGAIWNNPPYSNIRPWVEKAAEQCIQQRQTVVMLVPEDMSVGWFSKALESVDEVRIITDGRINFIEPSTGLEKKGNSKGSMLLIWRPFISPRRMFTTVSKAALMAIGQGVRRYE
ncbi:phage N-6-adenine-methyltransferase [Escherichia coli]|nr:phage N-6-adenine-methyltransferase [Escherichia coli]EGD9987791.1 phage N-6-adenine-methyltransferase [Escherichia coli]EGJ6561849.1 phage N-6-adenine-methyltransferase [Escherichia coli]TDE69997.1 phage N-6-adenine-methyltransferase [Escherichia sp. KCJ4943]HAH8547232.1 phage N-6-adenine-methyltransferase [Escherichia coli]